MLYANVPTAPKILTSSIPCNRITHYGEDFSVIARNDPNNTAYTTNSLSLHLDLPYYVNNPEVREHTFSICTNLCYARNLFSRPNSYTASSSMKARAKSSPRPFTFTCPSRGPMPPMLESAGHPVPNVDSNRCKMQLLQEQFSDRLHAHGSHQCC